MKKATKRKAWSATVEEFGTRVRVYERVPGSVLYLEVRTPDGKDRRSLKHRDRALAEDQARALARELAKANLEGRPAGSVTFGELRNAYLRNRGPLLRPDRLRFMKTTLNMWAAHLEPGGRPFRMEDFDPHHAETYLAARRSGGIRPDDRRATTTPRDGTLRNELLALSTVCNWGAAFRVGGRRLLSFNPVSSLRAHGFKAPAERNPRRPRASVDRYRKLLAVADRADRRGQFRLMLVLAWHLGRRINAITHLRVSDVLRDREQVRATLAAMGEDESLAEVWPQAIRWRGEFDKIGAETVSPYGAAVKEEVDRYLARAGRVGEAWLFTRAKDPERPPSKLEAAYYLRQAEKLAGLPKMERGGWHAFRRAWASARKALPVQDVMLAGGWRDVKALQSAYQGADAATVLQVVELSESA